MSGGGGWTFLRRKRHASTASPRRARLDTVPVWSPAFRRFGGFKQQDRINAELQTQHQRSSGAARHRVNAQKIIYHARRFSVTSATAFRSKGQRHGLSQRKQPAPPPKPPRHAARVERTLDLAREPAANHEEGRLSPGPHPPQFRRRTGLVTGPFFRFDKSFRGIRRDCTLAGVASTPTALRK